MGGIYEIGSRGERLLAEYLMARGRTVKPSDRKTFDLVVDGKYAEVKTSDAPYSKLGFIGLTDAQFRELMFVCAFCMAKAALCAVLLGAPGSRRQHALLDEGRRRAAAARPVHTATTACHRPRPVGDRDKSRPGFAHILDESDAQQSRRDPWWADRDHLKHRRRELLAAGPDSRYVAGDCSAVRRAGGLVASANLALSVITSGRHT